MPTDQPVRRVVAVVVTFNRHDLLQTLVARLAEVRERTPALVEVLVVDNASTDDTGEWLAGRSDVTARTLPDNRGGAGGFHAGLRWAAEETDADLVWLMDDDGLPEVECLERLLREMRYSLAAIVAMDPEVTGVEYSPQFAQVAGPADVMVVMEMELRIDDVPFEMSVCLPFSGLHPHLAAAAAPAPVSNRERAQRAEAAQVLQRSFTDVPVDVSVRFRSSFVDPALLSSLSIGDVLRLGHPASAPLDITVDDEAFAHATPGTQGERLAALIVAARPTSPDELAELSGGGAHQPAPPTPVHQVTDLAAGLPPDVARDLPPGFPPGAPTGLDDPTLTLQELR